jgi:hypothetical protein
MEPVGIFMGISIDLSQKENKTKYHAKIDMLLIESALIKYVEHFKIKIIPFKSNYANDIYIHINKTMSLSHKKNYAGKQIG